MTRRAILALAGSAARGQKDMFADAEGYERFMGRWSRLLALPFAEFAALPDKGRVLDIGCGSGALTFAIAGMKREVQVVGIDPSEQYVAYAQSRNSAQDRVRFETGDAQKLKFADALFDVSVSLLVFNFIPDPAFALKEARRVTKKGGCIAAAVWDYGAGMRMLRIFWDAAVSMDHGAAKLDEKDMPLCRAGELTQLWMRVGLKQIVEHPLEIAMRFPSFADYWDPFLLGQGPAGKYVKSLDTTRLDKLRGEMVRRLGIRDELQPFELQARAWAVRGFV